MYQVENIINLCENFNAPWKLLSEYKRLFNILLDTVYNLQML